MAKPPNYKQDKNRREEARKKRNQEKQARLMAGKSPPAEPNNDTPNTKTPG